MVDERALGWILASLLGLFALYKLAVKSKNSNSKASPVKRSECVKSTETTNGECRSKSDDVDVIIVGAGVAGSALAHTLGKVKFRFRFLFFFLIVFLHFLCRRTVLYDFR